MPVVHRCRAERVRVEQLKRRDHHQERATRQPGLTPAEAASCAVAEIADQRVGDHVGDARQHQDEAHVDQLQAEVL